MSEYIEIETELSDDGRILTVYTNLRLNEGEVEQYDSIEAAEEGTPVPQALPGSAVPAGESFRLLLRERLRSFQVQAMAADGRRHAAVAVTVIEAGHGPGLPGHRRQRAPAMVDGEPADIFGDLVGVVGFVLLHPRPKAPLRRACRQDRRHGCARFGHG